MKINSPICVRVEINVEDPMITQMLKGLVVDIGRELLTDTDKFSIELPDDDPEKKVEYSVKPSTSATSPISFCRLWNDCMVLTCMLAQVLLVAATVVHNYLWHETDNGVA